MRKAISIPEPRTTRSEGRAAAVCDSGLPPNDARHVVLDQYGYRCAFCGTANRAELRLDRIVPESYGGPEELWNLWALCHTCVHLRHQMKGSSAVPPDPEGLRRVLEFPHRRDDVLRILKYAAERALDDQYDSLVAGDEIDAQVSSLVGYALRRRERPDDITPENWTWLCSSAAWDAVYKNAYALLPVERRRVV